MKIKYSFITLFLALLFISASVYPQTKLKPGFDAGEYASMLKIASHNADTPWVKTQTPYPNGYNMVYRSETLGLDNRWDLWLSADSVAVISIRGTTAKAISWLEDFYAPMVSASGSVTIGEGRIFTYSLASDTNAYVHAGFLLGLAYLEPSIITKINEYYNKGVRDFIIMGHSQGGAVAYLLRSYLHYLPAGVIPPDVTFKTYMSAPPKPGNLYYAYDYEHLTRGGWANRVVNIADWVPNMPFSLQTEFDLNKNNPIVTVDSVLTEKLNFVERVVAGLLQKNMLGSLDDARDVMIKYLGYELFKAVEKELPGITIPRFITSQYYMTAGSPVILKPLPGYYEKFPEKPGVAGIFVHHFLDAYLFLLEQNYPK